MKRKKKYQKKKCMKRDERRKKDKGVQDEASGALVFAFTGNGGADITGVARYGREGEQVTGCAAAITKRRFSAARSSELYL